MGQQPQIATARDGADERLFVGSGVRSLDTRADLLPQAPTSVSAPVSQASWLAGEAARWREAGTFERETGTAFLFVPVLFGCGVLAYRALPVEPALVTVALAGLTSAVLAWAAGRSIRRAQPVALVALAVIAGVFCAKLETLRAGTQMLGSSVTTQLSGFVREIENRANGRVRLTIDLTATERPKLRYQPQRIRATMRAPAGFQAGDHITGRARLLPHRGPVLPGSYDFAYHGYYAGVGANGFFLGRPERTETPPSRAVIMRLGDAVQNLRHVIAARIANVSSAGDPGAIAAALVTGLTDPISQSGVEVLRRTGLAHILSISGLHMALVAGIFLAGLRALAALFPLFSSKHPVKKYAATGALVGAFVYLNLAGGSVATQRSFIMLAVMLLALLFDRAALTMRNLAIAAMIVLALSPHEIAGPSFQMSFAATAALIAIYAAVTRHSANRPRRMPLGPVRRTMRALALGIGALALTALVGGAATAPFAAYHFHAVAPLGLITNVLAMPIVSLIVMPAGVIGTLLMPLGLDAPVFALMAWGTARVLDIAQWVDGLAPPGVAGLVPSGALALMALGMCVMLLPVTRLRLLAVPPLLVAALLLAWRPVPDILVSEDARLVAVRTDDDLLLSRKRANAFLLGIWQKALGGLPDRSPRGGNNTAEQGGFACDGDLCVFDQPGRPVVVHSQSTGEDAPDNANAIVARWCGRADLVVIADATAEVTCDAPQTLIVTARQLALQGSMAMHWEEEATPPTAVFAHPGINRPWHDQRRFSRAARGLPDYR